MRKSLDLFLLLASVQQQQLNGDGNMKTAAATATTCSIGISDAAPCLCEYWHRRGDGGFWMMLCDLGTSYKFMLWWTHRVPCAIRRSERTGGRRRRGRRPWCKLVTPFQYFVINTCCGKNISSQVASGARIVWSIHAGHRPVVGNSSRRPGWTIGLKFLVIPCGRKEPKTKQKKWVQTNYVN